MAYGLTYTVLNLTEGCLLKILLAEKYNSIPKSAKYQNLQKLVTWIYKVKIGLSPELMNFTFEFIEKPYSMRINTAQNLPYV